MLILEQLSGDNLLVHMCFVPQSQGSRTCPHEQSWFMFWQQICLLPPFPGNLALIQEHSFHFQNPLPNRYATHSRQRLPLFNRAPEDYIIDSIKCVNHSLLTTETSGTVSFEFKKKKKSNKF
ncbi:unnamed protein product [Ixodes persulcatus]